MDFSPHLGMFILMYMFRKIFLFANLTEDQLFFIIKCVLHFDSSSLVIIGTAFVI